MLDILCASFKFKNKTILITAQKIINAFTNCWLKLMSSVNLTYLNNPKKHAHNEHKSHKT